MQTLASTSNLRKTKALLSNQAQAEIASERVQLELLWATACARFKQDYTAFLALKVNHDRQAQYTSLKQSLRLQPTMSFRKTGTISQPLFFNLKKPNYTLPVGVIERPYSFTSEPTFAEKTEKEQALHSYFESANRSLEQATEAGLRACRHIMTVLYQAYGGKERIAFPGVSGRELVSPHFAAEMITRAEDHKLFHIALLSAAELDRLGSAQSSWMRPDLRKECIGLTIQRLLNQIAACF